MLRENLETMAEVRLQNYEDVARKLRELDAEDPGHGDLMPGGMYRREINTVPSSGNGSAPQDMPRGGRVVGATKDRQFTDQCSDLEQGQSVVLTRLRSCHFCDGCMRLDPMERANRKESPKDGDNLGAKPCSYEDLCGPADNVLYFPRKEVKGTKNRPEKTGDAARTQLARTMEVGEHCAFAIESEAEPWVVGKLRRKVWQQGDSDVTMLGKRGEPVKSGEEYFTVQKLDSGYGDSGYQHLEVDGDEGILIVPAKNLIARKIGVVLPSMSRSEKEAVIGPEEYGDMDRAACSALFRSVYSYLPQREREKIWGLCPQ